MTSIYQSTLIILFISKIDLILAKIMLDYCERKYIYHLFTLSNEYFAKNILLITLKIDNKNLQSRELVKNNKIWFFNSKLRAYS